MMNFRTRLRRLFGLRASFAAMFVAAAAMLGVNPTEARAEHSSYDEQHERVTPFTPGHWHVLGSPTDPTRPSLAALMLVESQTGAIFCKTKERDGTWRSNLIDCSRRGIDTNRIDFAASPGVMMPGANDFFRRIFDYGMAPTRHDRNLTPILQQAQRTIVARASDPTVLAQVATPSRGAVLPAAGAIEVSALPAIAPARVAVAEPVAVAPHFVAQPDENGRFQRANAHGQRNWYTRMQSPDGQTFYDVQDRTGIVFRVYTKANGSEGFSTDLRGMTRDTMVAYGSPAVEPAVMVAGIVESSDPAGHIDPVRFGPLPGFGADAFATAFADVDTVNGGMLASPSSLFLATAGVSFDAPAAGRVQSPEDRLAALFAERANTPVRASILGGLALNTDTPPVRGHTPAKQPGLPLDDERRTPVAIVTAGADVEKPLSLNHNSLSEEFRSVVKVRHNAGGEPGGADYLRVVLADGRTIDIADNKRLSTGSHVAFENYTDRHGRQRYRLFDLDTVAGIKNAVSSLRGRAAGPTQLVA